MGADSACGAAALAVRTAAAPTISADFICICDHLQIANVVRQRHLRNLPAMRGSRQCLLYASSKLNVDLAFAVGKKARDASLCSAVQKIS